MIRKIRQFIARIRIFHNYAKDLNKRAEVESVLWSVAAGKREALTKDECRQLALKLGVPDSYRSE